MPKYRVQHTMQLDTFTLEAEIEADNAEAATAIMERNIENGVYDEAITQHANSVGYEIVDVDALLISRRA